MPTLLDTNALIYALSALHGEITPQGAASVALFRSPGGIALSAMSWFEAHRFVSPLQRAALTRLTRLCGDIEIIPIDERIAIRACELLSMRRSEPSICPVCFGVKGGPSCKGCKRSLSKTQRFADAMIVATADCEPDIDVLYSFDTGVIDMGRLVSGCEVRHPMADAIATDHHASR